MKTILTLVLMAMAALPAFASDADVLPGSNELNSAVLVSTAITPAAVSVSSTAPTRIDTALNTALAVALKTDYKRAAIEIVFPDPSTVNCGYSAQITTQTTGGVTYTKNADPKSFALGKAIGIWCQGIVSTATVMVGGLGYR